MTANAIEIQNLSFAIGGKTILDDITLSVKQGEFFSIIGPNGAGKTTLLRCIDRICTGATGAIFINGKLLSHYSQIELARKISYVPQAGERQFPFTVHEFVMMGRYPHLSAFSSIKPGDEEVVSNAMGITGTGEFSDRLLNTLSSGERQKVFIAAALAQQAGTILLDEPTTFLDYRHQLDIQKLLGKINRESGTTIVSVTHDINSAALTSHRIAALKCGRIIFDGTPRELMKNDVLRQIYEKPFLFVDHPESGLPIIVPEEIKQ